MMKPWQVKLFLEAQAEMVRVEGMKAANLHNQLVGRNYIQYGEPAFDQAADKIEALAEKMVNKGVL